MSASIVAIKNPDSAFERLRRILPQAVRFVGSGLMVFPLGLGISAACHEFFGLRAEVSTAIAIVALMIVNFVLGRRFVFRSAGKLHRQFGRFIAISLFMRGAEYLMFLGMFKLTHMPYLFAMMSALVISSMIKFAAYRTWVFEAATPSHPTDRSEC